MSGTTSPPQTDSLLNLAMKPQSHKSWFSFSRYKPNSIKGEEASLVSTDLLPAAAFSNLPNRNSNRFSAYSSDPQERF